MPVVGIEVLGNEPLLEPKPEHLVRLSGGEVYVEEGLRLFGGLADQGDDYALRVDGRDLLYDR